MSIWWATDHLAVLVGLVCRPLYKSFFGANDDSRTGLAAEYAVKTALEEQYAENLAKQVRESDLDAAVVLAQDIPYNDEGCRMPNDAQCYVANDYVEDLAKKHPELIPACSIHPGRPDAMEELERCITAKMPVLKLLPNCLNIDYEDDRYLPFWSRMAEEGMILLTLTGGELTVKVYDASFGDPKRLAKILDCGVTVIAAHSAGRSGLFDPDWTGDLIDMFGRYPNLYADNSALCSPNRARTLKHILPPEVQQRIIHGSDYPMPVSGVGPWLCGKLKFSEHWKISKSKNILQRDYLLKKAIGFEADTFTRMETLLQRSPMVK
ncbi:MAG: amidohydrolase family protein [Rubritalea sp.]|uniref:amidohydrolase family protein n=1 Tax=Rubritalea sp. TaxID=2109375 RepID=UPI003241BD6F